ncbi:hypothetical protein CANARDRAFT_26176 [[Candida] arabinofermentans NRRL YB-2248]|uniref:Nitrogen permease regulator 3 n=1 Tax=[Candida] arabinofermentans NRRL YB-2248 TaxID=983967 RepID=A0A1E4T8F4_9ASCO|nr:hypothetical protein CANARDRAFT_26176 [[Candida] arabinofermentans NRRL YB-2248]
MSTLYLPNPCLLGILLTISTHDGNQLVFHYPPNPNEYGYQATPLGNQVLNTDDDAYSSSSDDEDDDYDEFSDNDFGMNLNGLNHSSPSGHRYSNEDDSSLDGNNSIISSTGAPSGPGFGSNATNTYSGKDLLNLLDEQDRKRKRKEKKRKNLMKKIIMGEQQLQQQQHQSLSSPITIESGPNSTKTSSVHLVNSNANGSPSMIPKSINSNTNMTVTTSNTDMNSPTLASNDNDNVVTKIDKLFGFDVDFVAEITTPPKKLCNTRFELSVDDMAFLGLPTHINDDGNWRVSNHRKGKSRSKDKGKKNKSKHADVASVHSGDATHNDTTLYEDTEDIENKDIDEENQQEEKDESQDKSKNECPMYMFHLVFVMNPPVVEYNYRIDEMFHFVVHRLTLLLRYEQHKSNYVWEQSKLIMSIREQCSNLSINEQWINVIEKSSLANLICKTYQSISNSEIVNIEINSKLRSFQIPIRTEFNSLPPRHIKVIPGSTLSSVSPFNQIGMDESFTTGLGTASTLTSTDDEFMVYFALLLLDDPETIIKDIKAENDPLIASFIRMIKPTESLSRLSTLSGLDIIEVKLFANHLVYWRRAKAVLPLNPRNIYIVSPLAPLYNIYKDSVLFKQQFQSLPSLPNFLSSISASSIKPRTINSIIPSRDHRDLYMDAIGWLLKYGYLTHLQSFLYLKITKDIKIKVDEELETERKNKKRQKNTEDGNSSIVMSSEDEDDNKNGLTDNTAKRREAERLASSLDGSASNRKNSMAAHRNSQSSDINSIGNSNSSTALNKNHHAPNMAGLSSNPSTGYTKPMVQFEEEEEEDTMLLDPESATALERRWISECVAGQPIEIVNLFYKLLKYLNGRFPVELIMLKENVSRQDIRKLLVALEDHIITVRHW